MIKKLATVSISAVSMLFFAVPAFAHVIVYPHQAGIAATQVFDMSVPTEKDNPTVAIKLLIPDGLQEVVPSVKAGWTINVKKNGDTVTEIDWTGGNIPPEERDDFYFSAQVPAKETTLKWKAYQTYQDGSVVSWDHTPTSNPDDDSAPPPYSQTKIVNDLTGSNTMNGTQQTKTDTTTKLSSANVSLPLWLSIIAVIFSFTALRKASCKDKKEV